MTLREFTKNFMDVNNITTDLDKMINHIVREARKKQHDGCAMLSEEDVEKIILGADTTTEEAEPAWTARIEAIQEEKKQKAEKRKKQETEKKDEQMSFDLWGTL